MAWLCNCDDDTEEIPRSKPPPPQPKRSSRDAQLQNQQAQQMPPSEGELAPEFSVQAPGLEGQSGVATSFTSMRTRNYNAAIEAGGVSSCSRKKSSSGDIIRRADEPGGGVRKASQESSDKGSVKGDENETPPPPPESPATKSDSSSKHKRHKDHKRHERDKVPCNCPMYEVEVIRRPVAAVGTGRQLPSDRLGMQVVTTETVTKRQFTYNMDIDLPEGMRVSPRGKLVEDQGVSAEQGLEGMSPYGLEPYQPSYGQNYAMPQGAASQQLQPISRFEQYSQQQISRPGQTYGLMQAASYETLAPVPRYDAQLGAQPFRAGMYGQPPQTQPPQYQPPQYQPPQFQPPQFQPSQFQPPQIQPPQTQQLQIVQRCGVEPKKVDSLVFQCMCGHGQNDRKSTTTSSTTTSKTKTTSTTKSSSTKSTGNKTSSSTKSSKDKKSSKGSSSTKSSASRKRGKGSSSTSSSSSTTTSSSTRNRKADEKPGFMQVDIHCDRCGVRKTYLVCKSCYSRHQITTCKDCKAPTVRQYIRYPSNNASLNAGARMTYQPELPPQRYGQQQQQQYGQRFGQGRYQEQPYEGAMVQALADKQAGLIVCCSSRTMLPISNANMVGGPVYQDPGAAQGAVTTNIVLLDVMPYEQEGEESATSSSTTTTSTVSAQSPTKSGTQSPTKSNDKSRTTTKTGNEDELRGSSLCKCGHDSRICRVCSGNKHTH